jgi:hypothetical protein
LWKHKIVKQTTRVHGWLSDCNAKHYFGIGAAVWGIMITGIPKFTSLFITNASKAVHCKEVMFLRRQIGLGFDWTFYLVTLK